MVKVTDYLLERVRTMNRDQLNQIILDEIEKLKFLFTKKNTGYGGDEDGLYNFRESAARHFGEQTPENMYKVLAILRDKHDVALAKNGLNDPDFSERMRDSVVYGLLALAIKRYQEGDSVGQSKV